MIALYITAALIISTVIVIGVKVHDGEVTVGDLLAALFFGAVPGLNVLALVVSVGFIFSGRWWARFTSFKLF